MKKLIDVCDICGKALSREELNDNYVLYGSVMIAVICNECYSKIAEDIKELQSIKDTFNEKESKLDKRLREMRDGNEKLKDIHR